MVIKSQYELYKEKTELKIRQLQRDIESHKKFAVIINLILDS